MIDTSKLDEPRWYVLHTFTGYENMAVDNLNKCIIKNNLQEYIMEVKVPMETVIEEDKNGKKKAVERKLFPCYILIKMRYTDSLWHTIVNSRGVTGFVGPQGRPLPGKADRLGDGGGQSGSRHSHVQGEDEDGVQQTVEHAAEAHADHGKGGAALAAQTVVHHKVAGHQRRRQQHIGGIVHGVLLAGGGGPQQAHHGGHEDAAQCHQGGPDGEGGEKGGGQHPAGLFVIPLPQQPGDVAVGPDGQHGAAHHDQLIQRRVDADGGGGVGAQ